MSNPRLLLLLALAGCGERRAGSHGRVTDLEGKPLAGVAIKMTHWESSSSSNGCYQVGGTVSQMSDGAKTLTATATGYKPASIVLASRAEEHDFVEIQLAPTSGSGASTAARSVDTAGACPP